MENFIRSTLIISVFALLSNSCTLNYEDEPVIGKYEKIELACKVWGFLKYHHPKVNSGVLNWDNEFFRLMNMVDSVKTKEEINNLFGELLKKLQLEDTLFLVDRISTKPIIKKYEIEWIDDTSLLSPDNSNAFKGLINSILIKYPYYITNDNDIALPEFDNEISYSDSTFPSINLRLLALARYWNIIYYFYPHLELNDIPWDTVLRNFIPRFLDAKDTMDYHLTVLELTAQLNDGHVWTLSNELNLFFGIYSVPVKLRYVQDLVTISEFFSDSIIAYYNIKIGDIILEINGRSVDEIIDERSKYYSFSNEDHHFRRVLEDLLTTDSEDSISLTISRFGSILNVRVKPYLLYQLYQIQERENKRKNAAIIINDTIGYINLKYLEKDEVKNVLNQFIDLDKLIIDIRNYPHGVIYEVSNFLNLDSTEFVKVFAPNIHIPGTFYYTTTCKTGMNKSRIFSGEIVLLVNEETQSHAEFTAMCFQASENAMTVGSTTAGTDGNVSNIILPGGIMTSFTGLGIEYPDGTPTQRIGLKIDYFIKQTVEELQIGKDTLINFAINL
jgi:C-terminal processing protease CtpA/Prc